MKVVLYEPQIPQNTGNIVRTCSVTGSDILLVEPLGFSLDDRWLKRAGLDYWEGVNMSRLPSLDLYLESCLVPFFFLSSQATKSYSEIPFTLDTHLIFGSEDAGLPPLFHQKYSDYFYRIPMKEGARCLNLATSVGIVLYEGYRQLHFPF